MYPAEVCGRYENISDEAWHRVKEVLAVQWKFEKEQGNYFSSIETMAALKLVFGERFKEILQEHPWSELKKEYKAGSARGYLAVALAEKILAAEEVKVTEKGFEFKMPHREMVANVRQPETPLL